MERVVPTPRLSWDDMLQRDLDQRFPDSISDLKKLPREQKPNPSKSPAKTVKIKVA